MILQQLFHAGDSELRSWVQPLASNLGAQGAFQTKGIQLGEWF